MGTFFGSIHVRAENSEALRKVLPEIAKEGKNKFLVGPVIDGWISIFPEDGGQDNRVSDEIAKRLSGEILHLIVHDSDIFNYFLHRDGKLIDQYNSCPEYFGGVSEEEKLQSRGRPELLQHLLRRREDLDKLTRLLSDKEKFTFEQERIVRFIELIGLPNALSSYEYLQSGERDGIKGWKEFVHIPDLIAEKAAKRMAQAAVKAEKKRLQKEGILLAEFMPPKRKGVMNSWSIAWSTDFVSNGLLLVERSNRLPEIVGKKWEQTDLMIIQPPWNVPPQPMGLRTNWAVTIFQTSPSGKWLAGGFGYGDWMMRVWDWQKKVLAFEVEHTRAVGWVDFSSDERWVYSLGGDEFIVTSLAEKCPKITVKGMNGARAAAVHPTGRYVVVAFQDSLGIIDLEQGKLVKRLSVNRGIKKLNLCPNGLTDEFIQSCLEGYLENEQVLTRLGISTEQKAALLKDAKQVEHLSADAQQQITAMFETVRYLSYESREQPFDLQFSPNGEKLFLASEGMRVFDWTKVLSADKDTPPPEFSVDAPRDDENDPNSRPLAYCVRFDPERQILLSSCLAGVIQYLSLKDDRSGTLLKLQDDAMVWRVELTTGRKALCCHCALRPGLRKGNKGYNCVQVWNYPALCRAAGLD